MKLLALDTATESCSAALWIDGRMTSREAEFERGHAERILPMVDELLAEAGVSLRELNALAFGRGPGSFTGVRLAASVVQGLAFGAALEVVPISDLQAVAQRVFAQDPAVTRTIICNDARMQEVYWACYERGPDGLAVPVEQERVGKPSTVRLPASWMISGVPSAPVSTSDAGTAVGSVVAAAGRGFIAYPDLRSLPGIDLTGGYDRLLPRAPEIALLAAPQVQAGRTVPAEAAIPVYLRDDVAHPGPQAKR